MLDGFGLTHMNGRVYDPQLGRFLSVDPVFQFPTNTQSLNPYTYVLNAPLTLTDPTGLMAGIDQLGRYDETTSGGMGIMGQGGLIVFGRPAPYIIGPQGGPGAGGGGERSKTSQMSVAGAGSVEYGRQDVTSAERAAGEQTNGQSLKGRVSPETIEGVAQRKLQKQAEKVLTEMPVDGEVVKRNRETETADGRFDPNGMKDYRSGRVHEGLDVAVEPGTSVKAAGDGLAFIRVNSDQNKNGVVGDDGFGYYVEILHADGVVTRYAHLQKPDKEVGSHFEVKAGDEIGKSGRTGNVQPSAESHVHLEVEVRGTLVDPQRVFGY